MIKYSLIISLLVVFNSCYAQKEINAKYPLVHVKDWRQKSFMVTEDFWNSTKADIVKQIGEENFEKVKTFSTNKNVPVQLLQWDGHKKVDLDEYCKRLSSLKVYRVAEFNEIWKDKDWGKYMILSVPNQELYWDKTAKWDTVYFIIKADAVEEI